MPFIRIESLPFEQAFEVPDIVRAINRELAAVTAIDLDHLHTCWSFVPRGCYAKGDSSPEYQPELNHPLIVDLLAPDFIDDAIIKLMFETIADSISRHASFPRQNIFINHRIARSGRVFDDGSVVDW